MNNQKPNNKNGLNRRRYDKQFDVLKADVNIIKEGVAEIHQRQTEITIPKIQAIEKCLYGNGDIGLLEEHVLCKERLNNLIALKIWVIAISGTLVAAVIGYAVAVGKIIQTIDFIRSLLTKHLGIE
jgi:hypothetical protein